LQVYFYRRLCVMKTIDNVVNEVFEECDKEINKSGAKAELNNVIDMCR